MSGEDSTAMSHETHGLCFCAARVHCKGDERCDGECTPDATIGDQS